MVPAATVTRCQFGRHFVPDDQTVAGALDLPATYRVECRRSHGLTGIRIETGVVPRAADGTTHNEAVDERTFVVGTERADGANIAVVALHEQDGIVTHVPKELAIAKVGQR